ncbi:MAG TPA: DUF4232 domain-containing protein [Pseudonocardiaceae bacterium]|jgi:hypothetical protein|nr:DUF4232 domain-containing protein [Pseudonocardiaceae bacterium]
MVRNIISRTILAGAGILALVVVAGCGGGQSSAGGTSSAGVATPSTAPATTPTQTMTATAPPATSSATGGGGAGGGGGTHGGECKAADLKLSLGSGDAGMSHDYTALQFTNISGASCVLVGFPGVSYVTGDNGQQVGAPAVRDGSIGAQVTLAPGQTASATVTEIQVGVFDPNVCKPTAVRGLRVYPPDDTSSMFVAQSTTGCAGNPPDAQLHVQTIKKG